jgi:hypothetical protein
VCAVFGSLIVPRSYGRASANSSVCGLDPLSACGTTRAAQLVGFTPAGIEGFFRESGRPAADDGPAPPLDDDEIARTIAAAPNYGLQAVAFAP